MGTILKLQFDDRILSLAKEINDVGGKALVVGGYVRDLLLGRKTKDIDMEIFGLPLTHVESLLKRYGEVSQIGRAFGILRVNSLNIDFSLPRMDSKVSKGHKGFKITTDPEMSFPEAARRRDLTINALALNPLNGMILDPFNGQKDIENKILRATDPVKFIEDPLRALRVARFAAQLEMTPNSELKNLCKTLDLSELTADRVRGEFDNILLNTALPSLALEFMRETALLQYFPEISALTSTPQDPTFHPKETVFEHTKMVIDEAARMRQQDRDDPVLMYSSLCHDFGKPMTTEVQYDQLHSHMHDTCGMNATKTFLLKLGAPKSHIKRILTIVRHHRAPSTFYANHAKPKSYRRLARELDLNDVSMELLLRVATADHLGHLSQDSSNRHYPAGKHFLKEIQSLNLTTSSTDIVQGRHLIKHGLKPSKSFGKLLQLCRDIQDDNGWQDPERIIEQALVEKNTMPK